MINYLMNRRRRLSIAVAVALIAGLAGTLGPILFGPNRRNIIWEFYFGIGWRYSPSVGFVAWPVIGAFLIGCATWFIAPRSGRIRIPVAALFAISLFCWVGGHEANRLAGTGVALWFNEYAAWY